MKTQATMTICPVKCTPFPRIRTNCAVIDKIGRAIGLKAHELRDKWCLNKRLRLSPDVETYQCLREGPAGETAKREFKNIYVRSRNVYENKGNHDKTPGEKSDIYDLVSDIFG
jgi:hypothetical protein